MRVAERQALPAWAQDILEALPLMVSRAQAATALGISKTELDRLVRAQVIRAIRQGRRVTIPRLEIVHYLMRHSGYRIP
jgi:excisionase family DNA binding protein